MLSKYIFEQEGPSTSQPNQSISIPLKQSSIGDSFKMLKSWDINENKAKDFHYLIGEIICIDNQPYSIVLNIGFSRLMNKALPNYQLPSEYFREKIVPDIFAKCKAKIKQRIHEMVGKASFTSDIWNLNFKGRFIHTLQSQLRHIIRTLENRVKHPDEVSEVFSNPTEENNDTDSDNEPPTKYIRHDLENEISQQSSAYDLFWKAYEEFFGEAPSRRDANLKSVYERFKMEIAEYNKLPVLSENMNPLLWWKEKHDVLYFLYFLKHLLI
ncbi:unnamed protein product [Brassicogethes aeneus]|uniref:Uncharacterized protein n=1 Tax=Brassicogethes aeneus TaxID=1431903 RepID=A0A9P0FMB7_BRAAE|nr:unnamed protein product [Brassicogethes aeneus]